jgi:hypothetical protein
MSIVRVGLIAICTSLLLAAPGCTLFFGKQAPVDKCKSKKLSASDVLQEAPIWVPDSPRRADMPAAGCIGGDGSFHSDRLCVVGQSSGLPSVAQSEGAARHDSLRVLANELATRMEQVLGTLPTPPSTNEIKTFSKELRNAIGSVTDTWQSPNCTTFAIAEAELADFELVVKGPSLSNDARSRLLDEADKVVGSP